MEIQEIQAIVQFLRENDVLEFELKKGDVELKLSRGKPAQAVQQVIMQPQSMSSITHVEPAFIPHQSAAQQTQSAGNGAVAGNPNAKKVESPIVGTFYRKPSPDAPMFAKEGDRVRKGQTLCIIEAMKVMNEIESPCDGVVEKILPADGEVVEYGETLFLINP